MTIWARITVVGMAVLLLIASMLVFLTFPVAQTAKAAFPAAVNLCAGCTDVRFSLLHANGSDPDLWQAAYTSPTLITSTGLTSGTFSTDVGAGVPDDTPGFVLFQFISGSTAVAQLAPVFLNAVANSTQSFSLVAPT